MKVLAWASLLTAVDGLYLRGRMGTPTPVTPAPPVNLIHSVQNQTETVLHAHPDDAQMMQELDNIMSQNGGMVEGHSNQLSQMSQEMNMLAETYGKSTICETGFNGGHSALRFLLHSSAHVYSFDIGQHSYAAPAASWIDQKFPGRHSIVWGDSTQTLPQFHAQNPAVKCDVIFIDGGHSFEVATADFANFKPMSLPTSKVLIDDVHCTQPYCVDSALNHVITSGVFREESRSPPAYRGGTRGWAVGAYN